MNARELETTLETLMRESLEEPDGHVSDLEMLTGGASRQTWSFVFSDLHGTSSKRLVIQINSETLPDELISSESEAALLRLVANASIPVPEVIASGSLSTPESGTYFITTFIEGETLATKYLNFDPPLPGVANLMSQCANALAAIHRLPTSDLDLPEYDFLDFYGVQLDASEEAHPVLEWTYRWLVSNRPVQRTPCLVHGDFRLGNFIVDDNGLGAVLDWELAHLGSPLEDITWPLVRAWRFDRVRPKGVFPERASWVAAYCAASGLSIDQQELRWWEIASTFKWAVICMNQWQRHLNFASRSVELAAIGRRVVESEFDLLRMLP